MTTHLHNDTYPSISPLTLSLPGLSVLITGGSRGLGRATALSFAKAGASHIAVGARSDLTSLATDIATAASSAGRSPPQFLALEMDVTSASSVAEAAEKLERELGRLHVLVNNAGVRGPYGLIADSDPSEWIRVVEVNLHGPYLVTRAFLPLLLRSGAAAGVVGGSGSGMDGGRGRYIINVTSVAAHLTNPTLSAYQISKNALLKLSALTNAEYSEKGVVTFAIHPGNVATDIMGGPEAIPEHHKHGSFDPSPFIYIYILMRYPLFSPMLREKIS